jgi:hypothetical protein
MTPPPAGTARLRAGVAAPAPLRLPPAPRRVSGPAQRTRTVERPVTGFAAVFIWLIDHPWLERLVRGRAWIAIVASALLGIVAMQVALLRLGAQVGSQTAAVNSMIQRNEAMVATIGGLEASRGLGAPPSSLGMLYPPPGSVTYLQPSPGDAVRAVEQMTVPSAAAIAAAAAHPPRASTTSTASKTPATNVHGTLSSATGGAVVSSVGATGAAGTATSATNVAQTNGTIAAGGNTAANTSGTSTTTHGTSPTSTGTANTAATAGTTTGTARTTTPPGTPATGTPPSTTAAGGAIATTASGGTSAATTGANSGASVAPGATSAGG